MTAALALAGAAMPACGHSLIVTHGEAVVRPDGVRVRVVLNEHELTHAMETWGPAEPGSQRPKLEPLTAAYADSLRVRNAAGVLIACATHTVKDRPDAPNEPAISLWYPSDAQSEYLTFRFEPVDTMSLHRRQLVLLVCGSADSSPQRSITLTNAGNAETVAFSSHDREPVLVRPPTDSDACSDETAADTARFRELRAAFRRGDGEIVADVFVPAAMLATWERLELSDRDFLTLTEQTAIAKRFSSIIAASIELDVDHKQIASLVERAAFLAPAELSLPVSGTAPPTRNAASESAGADQQRLGFWTARLCVRLRYALPTATSKPVVIRWGFFNTVVLTADVSFRDGDRCSTHTFSTYTDTYAWTPRSDDD